MLTIIHLEELRANRKLTLDTPKLLKIKLLKCSSLRLVIVHGSVEGLVTNNTNHLTVNSLKNLKNLK